MMTRLFILIALLAAPGLSQGQCSIQNLAGTYAMFDEGTLLMTPSGSTTVVPVSTAAIGIGYFDPSGTFTGWIAANDGGDYVELDIVKSTYTVTPDCTLSATISLRIKGTTTDPGEATSSCVVDNREPKTFNCLTTKRPGGKAIDHMTWVRVSPSLNPPPCALSNLAGTYVVNARGIAMTKQGDSDTPTPVPISYIMQGPVNEQGKMTGGGSVVMGNQTAEFLIGDASFQLDSFCAGTGKWTLKDKATGVAMPGEGAEKFVVIQNLEGTIIKALPYQGITGTPVGIEHWWRVSQIK